MPKNKRMFNSKRIAEIREFESPDLNFEECSILAHAIQDHAIFSLDNLGAVKTWNAAAEKMFGFRENEIIGENLARFFSPDSSSGHCQEAFNVALGEGSFEEKIPLIRKDGSQIFCEVLILPQYNSENKLLGYTVINHDINKLKLAEVAVQEAEEKFHSISQSASDAIISINRKGLITSWNRGATHIFGYTAEQAMGQKASLLIPQRLRSEYFSAIRNLSRRIQSSKLSDKTIETFGLKCDGTEFPIEISISRSDRRFHTSYSAIIRDISDRHSILKLQNTRLNVINCFIGQREFKDVIDDVLKAICEGMGWKIGGLWVCSPDKKYLELKNCYSQNLETKKYYASRCHGISFMRGQGLPGRTWDGECLWMPAIEGDPRLEDSGFRNKLGVDASLSFSIGKLHEFYGVMEFLNGKVPQPDTRLYHFLSDMGSLLGLYIQRSQAQQQLVALNLELEKHVEARTRDLAKAIDRERFFSAASTELASSLDYKTTIQKIAQLSVPQFADCCIVNMLEETGDLPVLAISHSDPSVVKLLYDVERKYPLNLQDQFIMSLVIRSGRAIFVTELSESAIQKAARTQEHFKLLMKLNFCSFLCAPLKARGKILGTITLCFSSGSKRRYQSSDLCFIEDLADRAGLAIDNAYLYSEVEASNKTKDEFLATLSHELRTPLNVIQGWVNILKTEKLDEKEFGLAIEMLDRNSSLQARLINDLLDVSRIITGKLSMEYKPVDLVGVLRASVDAVMSLASEKGIDLRTQFENHTYSSWGDFSRLQRVFVNILSNAIKFTASLGRVEVSLKSDESHFEVSIKDTGQGIEPSFIPHIFESFKQEDSSSTRAYEGLGLGLAIAQHIVARHRGQITVKSSGKGLGSEFIVSLPRFYSIQQISDRSQERGSNIEIQARNLDKALSGVRILLVDDASDMLVLFTRFLQRSAAEVLAVQSAAEAFEALKKTKPDIILSDIGMPGEDGYSLIKKIRGLTPEEGGQIPAIALTAYAREEEKAKAIALGFCIHLSKPVQHRTLVETIYKLLKDNSAKLNNPHNRNSAMSSPVH